PRQRHRVRQPPRPRPRGARPGPGGARFRPPARDRRGRRLRPGHRPRPHAPRAPGLGGRARVVRVEEPGGSRGLQRERQFGVPDAAGGLTGERLERLLPVLERLTGARLRLRTDGGDPPPASASASLVPIPETAGVWLEITNGGLGKAQELAQIVAAVLSAERDAAQSPPPRPRRPHAPAPPPPPPTPPP